MITGLGKSRQSLAISAEDKGVVVDEEDMYIYGLSTSLWFDPWLKEGV